MSEVVTYEKRGDAGWIYMDDGKANAINGPLLAGLNAALDRAAADEASAVVLAGRLGFFSAGLDLKTLPTLPLDELKPVLIAFGTTTMRLASWPRPLITLSAGHALAGGQVLMMTADWRVGSRGPFKYGLTEVQIGVPMPSIVCELARHVLDPRWLHRAVGQGLSFTPEEAVDVGFLDELRDPAEVVQAAEEAAARLGALPDPAFCTTKARLRRPIIDAEDAEQTERELAQHLALLGR